MQNHSQKPLITIFLLLAGGCDSDTRSMTGTEVRALFSGKTVTGHHEKKGYDFVSYYDATSYRSYHDDSNVPELGVWRIDGNDICLRSLDEDEDLCRTMITDDQGEYSKVLVKPDGKEILIVTFYSFTDGNVRGL